MSRTLPQVFLVRHGETAWSATGQHTGLTDIPLTPAGESHASELQNCLAGHEFAQVWTSPLQRARRTCELAGFGTEAQVDANLVEWDYGDFEGMTTPQIHERQPDWQLFQHGCPGGESIAAVGQRADRVVARLRQTDGNVLLFSSGHFLRVLAARWLGLDAGFGRLFLLSTATLSILGYEHNRLDEPVIRLWNDRSYESSQAVDRVATSHG